MAQPRRTRDDMLLIAEVAQLYDCEERTQEQIARATSQSRSSVSNLLKEACEQGIVDIRVHYPFQRVPDLEDELRRRLGLGDCRVLAAGQGCPIAGLSEDAAERVGHLAARYLRQHVPDNHVVGLGWGQMVSHVVASGSFANKPGMTVVQVEGSIGGAAPDVDGGRLVTELGRALGARVYSLSAPLVVADPAVRTGLLRDQHIRQTLELGRRADVLFMGIGTVDRESGLSSAGYLIDADLNSIRGQGEVGDISGSYFARDGSLLPLELNDRVIALSAEAMRGVPLRVGVTSGTEKALPNVGAAWSALINVLITDDRAAEAMRALIEHPAPLEKVAPVAVVGRGASLAGTWLPARTGAGA